MTEDESRIAGQLGAEAKDLLTLTVGTGLRFGEVTALWCSDIDLKQGTDRVNRAWKRDGEAGETETPGWLKKLVQPKHAMRGHHLGNPKTSASRRTITIAPALGARSWRAGPLTTSCSPRGESSSTRYGALHVGVTIARTLAREA